MLNVGASSGQFFVKPFIIFDSSIKIKEVFILVSCSAHSLANFEVYSS